MTDARDDDSPKHANGALRGLRIILIEDNPLIALDSQDTLLQAGVAVVEIASSRAAIDEIINSAATHFDVAVTDLELGGESAVQTLDRLADSGLIVLVVSGSDHGRGYDISYPILAKPHSPEQLIAAVVEAVRRGGMQAD